MVGYVSCLDVVRTRALKLAFGGSLFPDEDIVTEEDVNAIDAVPQLIKCVRRIARPKSKGACLFSTWSSEAFGVV